MDRKFGTGPKILNKGTPGTFVSEGKDLFVL